jgi:hypothetical protein
MREQQKLRSYIYGIEEDRSGQRLRFISYGLLDWLV